MKKTIILFALLTFCLLPFSAFAMQSISDQNMDSITGQLGIDVAFDENDPIDLSIALGNTTLTIEGEATDNSEDVNIVLNATEIGIKIEQLKVDDGAGNMVARPLSIDIDSEASIKDTAAHTGNYLTLGIVLPTVKATISGTPDPEIKINANNDELATLKLGTTTVQVKSGAVKVQIR